MAVVAVTAAAFQTTLSNHPRIRFKLSCCLPVSYKSTRRKNHLRRKILKTLNPRFLPEEIPNPLVRDDPLDDSVAPALPDAGSAPERMNAGDVVVEGESLQSVEAVKDEFRDEGRFLGEFTAKDVVKFGFWFLGLFVMQTVCAVWVLGKRRREDDRNDVASEEVGKSVAEKVDASVLYGNGGLNKVVNGGGVDVEKRIEEIKLMAREARRMEQRGSQDGGYEGDGEGDEDEESSSGRTGIKKEIDARLEKLRKQFKSMQKSAAPTSNGSGHVEGIDGVDSSLMFKRKLKFRNPPPLEESSRPKGFNGGEFRGKSQKKKRSGATVANAIGNSGERESEKIISTPKNATRSQISHGQIERAAGDARGKIGENLQKSSQMTAKLSGVLPGGAMDIPSIKSKQMAGTKKVARNQLVDNDDQWWLSLPCVYAILMTRGPDAENPSGLFTLKIFSQDDSNDDTEDEDSDDEGLSYVIAFEHRTDASNFCFLLDSFFEDLGDFGADIVPLLKNDIQEMVREQRKIFVARKGQLQLYAGQPFREVEAALKSIIQGNQRQ
ncbi:hypothetical protein MLD38_016345 [Melastoma candidum]|uniref:Uncharacterized protein n=1 Tax=Melastoma candidum TaxID=119954 RepID=A0ACB9RIZ2_9MYRT|nr:hypothetical protein MLD38_016345 [Melastoma candidum]